MPTSITARPTTDFARENIFNVIENLMDLEGVRALDLFAGTGAITFELLSREAAEVTAVERAPVQCSFIRRTAEALGADNLHLVRGDALRYISTAVAPFDFIFADPPYDMDGFGEIPGKVLGSKLVKEGTQFVMEHSRKFDFSTLPGFFEHRAYGSVNFSLFRL